MLQKAFRCFARVAVSAVFALACALPGHAQGGQKAAAMRG